jgi:hypothetical protein
MKVVFTSCSKFLTMVFLLSGLDGCAVVDIKGAGVFKDPIKYDKRDTVYVDIPAGIFDEKGAKFFSENDGSIIVLHFLGRCGSGISLSGIMIPIVPWPLFNKCEEDGFYIATRYYLDTIGVTLQLHYNGTTYNPYIENGSVKFKIENFSAFKRATDKSLILHKRKPDGTIFTKELPFDWKIVVEVSGGL